MTDQTEPSVVYDVGDGYAKLTLNRPETLNAFTPDMHAGLMEGLARAEADPACRAVLITGSGRGFCAGQDLRDRDPRKMDGPPDLSESVGRYYNTLVRRIREFDKPVICAVNGVAAGAGIGIALACDITLASEEAPLAIGFSRIGLVPDAGTSWTLTRRLGEARAMGLALTGGRLSGREAADWGLIWRAVPNEDLAAEAEILTAQLARGPAQALRLTRNAIRAAADQPLDDQLELERGYQAQAGRNPDYAEGVLAFLEKRKPCFAGAHDEAEHEK
ncbi:enoyl-CoA hydratase-related protein [Stappia indica]|uniref:enoyl-CoA hydratase-related protein n=1 Tax=Stappia indica TaxID=538381 RepID=UPI001CD25B79|nr:enoyl-CoA hydratase-related protein [Stappia indica]MCA1297079.1 enoyl-CoA hydratase/isomerase family protein [Stappia indica]